MTPSLNKAKIASVDTGTIRTDPAAGIALPVGPAGKPSSTPVRIRSEELLQGQVELLITHGSETYRLRRTRSGKLILQK